MTNKYIILGGLAFMALPMMAKTISPDQALARIKSDRNAAKAAAVAPLRLAHTAMTPAGDPAVYVFNRGENAGYMLLSADDLAMPMLGYADYGAFSADNLSPAFEWWLAEYGRRIEYANQQAPATDSSQDFIFASAVNGEAIAPQIKTLWDQVEPYNNQAPKYGANRTYTGCVATAMAQVMNYWQYPEKGQGKISYTSESIQKKLELDFSRKKFDWANMLERYSDGDYTETQAEAVAYLMKACGYAVRSDYSTDATGALAMNIRKGLVKYFNYDGNSKYELRAYYSTPQWEQMIYDNLKNVGPILYGGGSYLGGGHSFVCDGYDGNGYFHFNWGWSGISNGYFSLDALSPEALGSGGGSGGGYNFTQDAVFGIQPPTGQPVVETPLLLTQMGSLVGSVRSKTLSLTLTGESDPMWVNYHPETIYANFGAMFEPTDPAGGEKKAFPVTDKNIEIQSGYGTGPSHFALSMNLDDAALADGTYKVSIVARDYTKDAPEWMPVRPLNGYFDYIFLTKKGTQYTVQNQEMPQLHIIDGNIEGTLYYGTICKVNVTVQNDYDIEISKGFAPVLFYEQDGKNYAFFLGQSVFISVPPHQKVTKEWVTDLTLLQNLQGFNEAMDFTLSFFDESTYGFYTDDIQKPITMYPYTSTPNIFLQDPLKVPGAEIVTEKVGESEMNVTLVKDKYNIPVSCSFRKSGRSPFAFNVVSCVLQPDFSADSDQQLEILTYGSSPVIIQKTNEVVGYNTTINFPQAKPDTYYAIMLTYLKDGYFNQINTRSIVFRLDGTSGIDSAIIDSDSDADAPIYNLQGICLGTDWDSLPSGLYIRAGKKIFKSAN